MKLGTLSHRRRRPTLVTALALLATLVLGGVASADVRETKSPLLFKGNYYRFEPGLMWGWDPDGSGRPLRYLGKMHVSDPRGTAVNWTTWNNRQAVGVGLARSSGCPMGGEQKGRCELGYPWNGTHLKVVAWRVRGGHFTRMKMFTRLPQSDERYYELVLAFRSPIVAPRTVSWRTIRTVRG